MNIAIAVDFFGTVQKLLSPSGSGVKRIEEIYGNQLPLEVHILLSLADAFWDSPKGEAIRVLDVEEVVNASEELHVDFVKKRLVPLMDLFDNNFLVFVIAKNKYSIMNINDESLFEDYESIYNFLISQK